MRALAVLLALALPAAAAPVPKGLKKPPATPEGVWRLVGFSSDGVELSLPQSMARDWVVTENVIYPGTRAALAQNANFRPNFLPRDPDRPNLRTWGQNVAVYEVDGDTLRACYAHDGRKELTECKPAQGIHYYVFERVKE